MRIDRVFAPTAPRRALVKRLFRGAPIVAAALLAACTVSVGTAETSPNSFSAQLAQDRLTGTYDPSGFTSDQVARSIGQICAHRRVSNYVEQPTADGRVAFSGWCRGGTPILMGRSTFTRFGDRVRIRVPGFSEQLPRYSPTWTIGL